MKDLITDGRIANIISALKSYFYVNKISELTADQKLYGLTEAIQLTNHQLDKLIAHTPQVLRTIKGHAFEVVFDIIMKENGYNSIEVGGDQGVDRIVNNYTLQLKTPYKAGTNSRHVQYKTHKTHGAKSERESMGYYHSRSNFADFLVGLVSYDPFTIIFIPRSEIPGHPNDPDYILSPFKVPIQSNPGLNAFHYIDISKLKPLNEDILPNNNELLPLSANTLALKTDIILDVILSEGNFRIWDMNIRGFAREVSFRELLEFECIQYFEPNDIEVKKDRSDKSDIVLQSNTSNRYCYIQVKGVTFNLCNFQSPDPPIGIETQLSRGRVSDHPTQSRLYNTTDFDLLVLSIDPYYKNTLSTHLDGEPDYSWGFYAIPTTDLKTHNRFPNRLSSHQNIKYADLQNYEIDKKWLRVWKKK